MTDWSKRPSTIVDKTFEPGLHRVSADSRLRFGAGRSLVRVKAAVRGGKVTAQMSSMAVLNLLHYVHYVRARGTRFAGRAFCRLAVEARSFHGAHARAANTRACAASGAAGFP